MKTVEKVKSIAVGTMLVGVFCLFSGFFEYLSRIDEAPTVKVIALPKKMYENGEFAGYAIKCAPEHYVHIVEEVGRCGTWSQIESDADLGVIIKFESRDTLLTDPIIDTIYRASILNYLNTLKR